MLRRRAGGVASGWMGVTPVPARTRVAGYPVLGWGRGGGGEEGAGRRRRRRWRSGRLRRGHHGR
eukprot:728245-Prorocentrum_minimum.AAC.1